MTELVIVLSTLRTSAAHLTYAPRSVFSHDARLEQTLETLRSVREKIPEAFILFVDATGSHPEIQQLCDSVWIPETSDVLSAVNSPIKGLGEAVLLQTALRVLKMSDLRPPKRIWKINGRYSLNEKFSLEDWDPSKSQAHFYNPKSCCTVLYTVTPADLERFSIFVSESASRFNVNPPPGMETIWSEFPFSHIDKLGVRGKVSVSGEEWSR